MMKSHLGFQKKKREGICWGEMSHIKIIQILID